MTKRKKDHVRHPSRLERIERKCDRILSEILILRQQLTCRPDIDSAIDRLHRAARKMRAQCGRERNAARRMLKNEVLE